MGVYTVFAKRKKSTAAKRISRFSPPHYCGVIFDFTRGILDGIVVLAPTELYPRYVRYRKIGTRKKSQHPLLPPENIVYRKKKKHYVVKLKSIGPVV